MRNIRIGIDVGGTHTKAVAIDNATNKIVGEAQVKTTHHHPKGVAQGVVDAFQKCIQKNNISPDEVIFIAHSTTQATNALIEGDVAKVGIIGMGGGGLGGLLVKRQTALSNIDLGNQKQIEVCNRYIKIKDFNKESVDKTIDELTSEGAKVIVASKAFGVDNMKEEKLVSDEANSKGLLSTAASEITKLYGLAVRTQTAAINASILPKMLDTANSTEQAVRDAGVKVPLMIMRGDGGVMEVSEMKKRPILTMLSGPAASVMGALMYLRASNGVYFEVGGTTTNIGVIKNGRPAVDYSVLGGHRTYVNSLDVRVLGVAGGSMVRANKTGIVDVGPRSAHIADLEYAAFSDPAILDGAKIKFIKPRENDPDDYVAIECNNGKCITITNTCAANALKLLKDGDFAKGSYEASYKAIKVLADYIGKSVEDTAKQILETSCNKIIPVIEELIAKYKIERDQIVLVGAGGGAGTLLAYTGKMMNFKCQIPPDAEIISSIGVALAMVREMVERTIPNPTIEDISKIKKEAKNRAIKSGAVPDSVEVFLEIDETTQKVTAIAMGSTEVKTTDLQKTVDEKEALEISNETYSEKVDNKIAYTNGKIFVTQAVTKNGKDSVRIIDSKGFVKVQRGDGATVKCQFKQLKATVNHLWEECGNYSSEIKINPDIYLITGGRVIDYSGLATADQVIGLAKTELSDLKPEEEIAVVAARNGMM